MDFECVLLVLVFDGVLMVFRLSVVQFNRALGYGGFGAISGLDMSCFPFYGVFWYV
jgi:hypothetical protein